MRLKFASLFLVFAFGFFIDANSQSMPNDPAPASSDAAPHIKKNFFKVNLTGIAFNNYAAQYERALTKTISLAISYRYMPTGNIPFKKFIKDQIGDGDAETNNAIDKLQLGNYAITPEMRIYLGRKGYGRGFYIAPFYRYASMTVKNLSFDYSTNTTTNSIALSGTIKSNTGGLMFGAQWALGKVVMLDWYFFGPHYGAGDGNISGLSQKPLTAQEQQELRADLEDLDIPLANKTVTVNAAGAVVKLDGPWAGIRAGLSLGIRF